MEIRNVEAFLKVAEVLNFTKAAELLGYTQGTVTMQIKQLEEEMQVVLFDRSGRSVSLTTIGEQFVPYAKDLVNAKDRALAFTVDQGAPKGPLTIGVYSGLAQNELPNILYAFHRVYPDIEILVRTADFIDVVVEKLRHNEVDIALCTTTKTSYQEFVRFAERPEETIFLCHPDNPLAQKDFVPLEEIARSPMILCDREVGYSHFMEEELAKRDLTIRPLMEFGYSPSIKALLRRNAGISYLPRSIVREELESGALAQIRTESLGIGIWSQMYYNRSRWVNPQMQAFIDWVRVDKTFA
ncbi:MAG: LysR family transcriptional regulator [Mogibacterium sp.]|nr:LysR family transcriptional regulator [Mogibacterium sp.]